MSTRPSCFVIIPYDVKDCGVGADGAPLTIDFEAVYRRVIEPAVSETLGYECFRSKDDQSPGAIPEQLYRSLFDADLVIADISQHNANVYYELGIRHTARPNTTVLIKHTRAPATPFDIAVLKHMNYDHETEAGVDAGRDAIVQAVRAARGGEPDSEVHRIIAADKARSGRPIADCRIARYRLTDAPDVTIGYQTGDIMGVRGVDVWVNSENTQMSMARFCESAISASIRFHGAENFVYGDLVLASEDDIAVDLAAEASKEMRRQLDETMRELDDPGQRRALRRVRGKGVHVAPYTVIFTISGMLIHPPTRVRLVAHVAAVEGKPTKGFFVVDDIGRCVQAVIAEIAAKNAARRRGEPYRSVLFPLFGTGQARADPARVVDQLIAGAIEAAKTQQPEHRPNEIYFLAYTEGQRDVLERELSAFPELEKIE